MLFILVMLLLTSLSCNYVTRQVQGVRENNSSVNSGSGGPAPAKVVQHLAPGPGEIDISSADLVVNYDLENMVSLQNTGQVPVKKIKLWVAMVRHVWPYQIVLYTETDPAGYQLVSDEYGNEYALFEFKDVTPGEVLDIHLRYEVAVNAVDISLDECVGMLPDEFDQPEQYIEADNQRIYNLAGNLSTNVANTCQQVEAFYNYIGDNIAYTGYEPMDLGALTALENRGGDCTEFSDLFIALNRSQGIPARFIEGVTYYADGYYEPGQTKHGWTEVYLPGAGWVPVDPTWGRRENLREDYFAAMSPDHIIVTLGRNPSVLQGYHYFYYHYWWDGDTPATLSADDTWDIVRVEE
jgi:hypothetical protein